MNELYEQLQHGGYLKEKVQRIEEQCAELMRRIDEQVDRHQFRVLASFRKHGVTELHLQSSTGYGYNDVGRETLEAIYCDLFGAEMALVRPQIVSGTHAIACCLYGVLRPGDELIYLTGRPYDTLFEVIGNGKDGSGSLADYGIHYREIPLTSNYEVDWDAFQDRLSSATRMIGIQRSRGYADRPSFPIHQIQQMIERIRSICPDAVIFVDNCYGEFVEDLEPTHVGADLIAGSLIKNPGGGLAKSGGYIAGKKKWVERAAARLIAPEIDGGASYGYLRDYYQGLFMAPHTVGQALKGVLFASALLEELGFRTSPRWNEQRTDIIQQIHLETEENLIAFCQSIQLASPIDSMVQPIPAPLPGYQDPVIMAAGTFVQGASIELSCDGPIHSPYIAYLQGGLTYSHVKIAILQAVDHMLSVNPIELQRK